MRYWSPIDTHVHLRWLEYAGESFLAWGIDDANAIGLAAVMEMGNTKPQITDETVIQQRLDHVADPLATVPAYHERPAAHYIHPGLTDSILDTVALFRLLKAGHVRVKAAKLYTCHSTGRMGLTDPRARANVWQIAAEVGYEGPVVVHAEDHKLFGYGGVLFRPEDPSSHSWYQGERAEISGAIETVRFAREAGFRGDIVFAHTSSPTTVEKVLEELREDDSFYVMFEVTWHHLFLNIEDDYPIHGNRVKMNPPLRSRESQERLLKMLVDTPDSFFIGSDHAPHPVAAKDRLDPHPASGIPAIPFWPRGIQLLRERSPFGGEEALRRMTFDRANKLFGLGLKPFEVETEYDSSRWDKYGWNPFSRLDA